MEIIVIGAGGHATSIAESILSCGHEILYFVDRYKSKDKLLGYKIVKNISKSKSILNIVIAIGDNSKRFEIHKIFLISNAHPPSKSDCIAILFLSLVVSCQIGSMPLLDNIEETTKDDK